MCSVGGWTVAQGDEGANQIVPAKLAVSEFARAIDDRLTVEIPGQPGAVPTPIIDDEAYLRRVSQDLIGELPSPEEITAFVLDHSGDKRPKAVERLLADPRYGENWGHYFRDVILYRRTDDRALRMGPAVDRYLAEQFNKGTGWDQIARGFITAEGDIRDNGNTGLIMAQMGQAAEIAAETARIFLGIQIQCAQCHDHPTDRWKREQFHELAAFFPRVAIRPVREGDKRVSFAIASRDAAPRKVPKNAKAKNDPEHYMPDLKDPSAKGTLMAPVFFVSGQELPVGTKDADRRQELANWITSDSNPWFARAFVNRIWAELVGQGFYEPVDDLGPDRKPSAPQTLERLAKEFAGHGYDVKWLISTIMATETYQRETRSRHDDDATPFAASCPQPLRADQVFDAVAAALDIDEGRFGPPGLDSAQRGLRGPRVEFSRTFGFDPSAPRDEVGASIPQALLMMNSPMLNRAIAGGSASTMLGKLLADKADDETIATELYLRCLAREPNPVELATCLSYISSTNNQTEGFEDILWALLNSTEFTHRK
jgi:hypothetical protein